MKGAGLPLSDQSRGCVHPGAVHKERSTTHRWLTDPGHCSASSLLNSFGGKKQCNEHMPLVNRDEDHFTFLATGSDPSLARVPSGKQGEALMSRILVVDTQRRPLMPCTPALARLL